MKLRIVHFVIACACPVIASSLFSGCGGGGGSTQYEFPEGKTLVISIGPAQSASPADVMGSPVALDRAWTLVFRSGAGLSGVVSSNGAAMENCVYSVRGDVNKGQYDLDISWGSLSTFPEYVSLQGVNFKSTDVNGFAAEWTTGRTVAVITNPVTNAFEDVYITFKGTNATVTWGPTES